MSFESTITKKDVMGSHRVAMGTFAQGNGDTGGEVTTGLRQISNFQMLGAKSVAISGGVVTVTTADPGGAQAGHWLAIGM
jgi:hypothetical protein